MRVRITIFSFLLFVACAAAQDPVTLVRGPYLQSGSPTRVTLRWRTDVPSSTRVEIGAAPDQLAEVFNDPAPVTDHVVALSSLAVDTRYFYAIGTTAGRLAGASDDYFFKTAPPIGTQRKVRVWALGDCGTGGDGSGRAEAVRDSYLNSQVNAPPDVWLMLGDNAYGVGSDSDYQRAVFGTYPNILRNKVLWSTMGNHEFYTDGGSPYYDIFSFPTNGESGGIPSGTEHYYSFDYANIHFVCLDSMATSRQPDSPMISWLEEDLAATTQKWIIAFWHHPPYTRGSHNSDFETELVEMRQNILPVLEAGGVDLILGGHSHSYERSFLIDGHYGFSDSFSPSMLKDGGDGRVDGDGSYGKDPGPHAGAVYVVAGTSGQVSGGSVDHPVMCKNLLVLGSLVFDVEGDRLDAFFLDDQGATRDAFSINKAPLVTIGAQVAEASEQGPRAGRAIVSRTREVDKQLTVNLTLGGTATPGVDYHSPAAVVTIPAGSTSTAINIVPISDSVAEGPETVRLFAGPGVGYRTSRTLSRATITIQDHPNDAWRFSAFGAFANNPAIAADTADPDGDGIPNLLERATGADPLAANSSLVGATLHGEFLTITFPRPASTSDLTYRVQVSSDLVHWDDGSRYSGSASTPSNQFTTEVSHIAGNPETITVRDNTPAGTVPRRFIRLEVVRD